MKQERELAAAVIGMLLREDYGGLSRRVRRTARGPELALPGGGPTLPLETDGFLADFRVASAGPPLTLDDVRAVLAAVADPRDAAGVAAFDEECRQTLAALRLRAAHAKAVSAAVAGPGPAGAIGYDALAAGMTHPAYPTSACRLGFTAAEYLRYAPEYLPEFELSWVAVPRPALSRAGDWPPPWWPSPGDVGLPPLLAGTHDLLPVHPVTAERGLLARALDESGLDGAVAAPGTALRVRPTLSVRTVAVTGIPRAHLKLPLPVSTLGLRNRRAIAPATLADGALVRRVLTTVIASDPVLGDPVLGDPVLGELLVADDRNYAHAGHPFLGCLLRLLPAGLGQCHVVPVAALLAPAGPRELVIDSLGGESVLAFAGAYFRLLFRVAVRLFVRYGIALESHQQNAALVLGPANGEMRLLVKDFDGTLINHARLAAALGAAAPAPARFADQRLLAGSDDELADVFVTITVHLCAGAVAFGLARSGRARLPDVLGLVRRSLADALDEYRGDPAAELLRARTLDAPRLPGKAMVTAGTLVDKARTGARDINKYIGTSGPNYLRTLGGDK